MTSWTGGAWVELGSGTGIFRGDADGWRTAGGVLVFGGWNEDVEEDLSDVRQLDDSFVNVGKYSCYSCYSCYSSTLVHSNIYFM